MLEEGTLLGKYRILEKLGAGGMADVYAAEDTNLQRKVALKILPPEFARDAERAKRFEKEIRASALLNHPHIVTVYDVGHDAGYHYYTMTLLTGGDLAQRIRDGLTPEQALDILIPISQALAHAHKEGFIHRDIKPENILFREDGSAVLTDFGIAKAVGTGTRMTGTGLSIGTPHYMSPEQAQGKQELDGRSDLYSLGIVFYEMLTGDVPYKADNTIGIAMQHVQAPIPELTSNLSKYQPLLDHLLAKQPRHRYQGAIGLINAIDQLRTGARLQRPVHATQVMVSPGMASSDTARHVSTRNDGLKWGVGGALLAAVIAVGLYVWQQDQMPRKVTGVVGTAVPQTSVTYPNVSHSQLKKDQPIEQASVETLIDTKAKEVNDLLNKAAENLNANELPSAVEQYRNVLKLDPNSTVANEALRKIAKIYIDFARNEAEKGDVPLVREYIRKVNQIAPDLLSDGDASMLIKKSRSNWAALNESNYDVAPQRAVSGEDCFEFNGKRFCE